MTDGHGCSIRFFSAQKGLMYVDHQTDEDEMYEKTIKVEYLRLWRVRGVTKFKCFQLVDYDGGSI